VLLLMRSGYTHARVNANSPQAWFMCDLCGHWWNSVDAQFQMEWSGIHLFNIRSLRCPHCIDVPQEQLRTIILPPDPLPIYNARVPNYALDEETSRLIFTGQIRALENGSGGGHIVRELEQATSIPGVPLRPGASLVPPSKTQA